MNLIGILGNGNSRNQGNSRKQVKLIILIIKLVIIKTTNRALRVKSVLHAVSNSNLQIPQHKSIISLCLILKEIELWKNNLFKD